MLSNRINAPRFNESLKRMIRTKKRKWNKYKRSRETSHLRDYRQYCRSVKFAVNSERAKYEKKISFRINSINLRNFLVMLIII